MSIKKSDLEAMSVDVLWSLHEEISQILSERILQEKQELEKRLAVLQRGPLNQVGGAADALLNPGRKPRRKYPRVLPKYRNPLMPTETWSGRGKQPRWLVAALKSGRKIEEFQISNASLAGGTITNVVKGRRQQRI